MNELDFIRLLKQDFANPWENRVGNDCALLNAGGRVLLSKDLLVEKVHFYPDIPLQALAYKSLVVNISDILSDGGEPLCFLLGIAAPKHYAEKIRELYRWYKHYTAEWNIPIIGGDTVASDTFILSVTVAGKAPEKPWLRKNAADKDLIYLTGPIGASAYGLEKIKAKGHDLSDPDIKAHLYPPCRLKETRWLSGKVNAAIDLSDGFMTDLSKLLAESGKGAVLYEESLPYAPGLPLLKEQDYGFYGGEDYELLFTAPKAIDLNEYKAATGSSLYLIGEINNEKNSIYLRNRLQKTVLFNKENIKGFDHWE